MEVYRLISVYKMTVWHFVTFCHLRRHAWKVCVTYWLQTVPFLLLLADLILKSC